MKRLSNINPWVWVITIIVIIVSIVFLVIALSLKVEDTISTTLFVDNQHGMSLQATSDIAYKITTGDKVTIKIDEQYFYCTIGNIFWDSNSDVCFEIIGLKFNLIPNSQLDVKIVTDTCSFGSMLFR